jgi:hypothetical protein
MSTETKHFISIWFFIGALLLVYGILILGAAVYGLSHPPEMHADLSGRMQHIVSSAGFWWGGLLIVLGAVYTYFNWPDNSKQ